MTAAMRLIMDNKELQAGNNAKPGTEQFQKVRRLFESALEVIPTHRSKWLHEACRGDVELCRKVEELLTADKLAGETCELVPLLPEIKTDPPSQSPGDWQIGCYQIVREIGRGGMGAVYLARRADELFSKFVALKVLRPEKRDPELDRRFRQEREIIGNLDHPNIARLLDGGTTAEGLPYSVMEYVEGQPIHVHCDEKHLNITARLKLFLTVCEAVQYAHRNLVVHRDLKPSNILVTADGTVKLLDFGIAKLMGSDIQTTMTDENPALRMLTLAYASPEQISGSPISTSSDVYSLGVVLYELLTGRRPYSCQMKLPHEVAGIICEQVPVRLSEIVLQEVEAGDDVEAIPMLSREQLSEMREGKPGRLQRRLAGELDSIVMMALRKEPQRRYSSVEQLSKDLSHHLSGLPILAQKDSLRYRVGKFIRRHRTGVSASALVILLMILAVVGTSWQAHIARRERIRAEHEAAEAKLQSNRAELRTRDAEFYRKRAEEEATFAKTQLRIANERTREANAKDREAKLERNKADRRAQQAHEISSALLKINTSPADPALNRSRQGALSKAESIMSALLAEGYDNPSLRDDLHTARELLSRSGNNFQEAAKGIPSGWSFSNAESYEIDFEKKDTQPGAIASIRNRHPDVQGAAELKQSIDATPYLGKRLYISCQLKSRDIEKGAGLFTRITGSRGEVLAYRKSENKSATTAKWNQHVIVFDVPVTSAEITIGFVLEGSGIVWADGFSFRVVEKSVSPTVYPSAGPLNLNFEAEK